MLGFVYPKGPKDPNLEYVGFLCYYGFGYIPSLWVLGPLGLVAETVVGVKTRTHLRVLTTLECEVHVSGGSARASKLLFSSHQGKGRSNFFLSTR